MLITKPTPCVLLLLQYSTGIEPSQPDNLILWTSLDSHQH